MLILFQSMSARLGIVTGHSLAYNIRNRFSRPWTALFGGSIVIACIATDVAELLGGALGFQILFGLPLLVGGVITAVLQILLIVTGRYRHIERIVVAFIGIIAVCYVIELALVHPDWGGGRSRRLHPPSQQRQHAGGHRDARGRGHAAQRLPALQRGAAAASSRATTKGGGG